MKCTRCGKNDSVIELKYNGERLCRECFNVFFEKRVRRTIRINRLLKADDTVVVGLSGGKDSAVVLHILKKLSERVPESSLTAVTIDEGIRGYSNEALKACKRICKKIGVENKVYSFKKEFGLTLDQMVGKEGTADMPACSYCGVLRRRLLNDKARELHADKLATGHNLDDEIQVGLMNYIRGDFERIARMGAEVGTLNEKKFVPRIKPLRDSPESEVVLYAKLNGLEFNVKKCPHNKTALRQTLRACLNDIDERHPGSKFQLLRSIDDLIPVMRKQYAGGKIGFCSRCSEPSSSSVCRVCEITEAVRKR